MFNLLRMDLYRMKRSKSVYVCFFTMLAVIFLCYLLVYLLGTPEGRKVADRIGMLTVYDSEGHVVSDPEMKMVMMEEGEDLLEDANLLEMFRDSDMRGGLHNILFGIAVALFVCGDYKGGSMKNIMALHRNRWPYIGSKLIAVGILDFLYLVLGFGFNCLMNLLFGNMLPFGSWGDILFYLAWIWPVTMAFAALIIALCVFTRSITIGVLGAVLGKRPCGDDGLYFLRLFPFERLGEIYALSCHKQRSLVLCLAGGSAVPGHRAGVPGGLFRGVHCLAHQAGHLNAECAAPFAG